MVSIDVLIKIRFEGCIAAHIREIEIYVKADHIEEKDESRLPFEYEEDDVHGSHEVVPYERPVAFNPENDVANPPLEFGKALRDALLAAAKAATPEAFRKKMTEMATIDEDTIRKWDLIGILCPHVIVVVWVKVVDLVDYIDECYSVEIYLRCYEQTIFPCNGKKIWPATKKHGPTPPKYGRKTGSLRR
ncbi:hypothetical protein ACH5RR_033960 [Cinchona calisaya]|uniref:Uncharacterized protein n=1 Tax=Cinchona calisaya TaxID=153742 RepID=A0ABD2Y9H4_9GENT